MWSRMFAKMVSLQTDACSGLCDVISCVVVNQEQVNFSRIRWVTVEVRIGE